MDTSHVIVALLIGHGLLVAREDYRVVLTRKGREVLAKLPLVVAEGKPKLVVAKKKKRRWSVRVRSSQRSLPWAPPRGDTTKKP